MKVRLEGGRANGQTVEVSNVSQIVSIPFVKEQVGVPVDLNEPLPELSYEFEFYAFSHHMSDGASIFTRQ